MFGKIFSVVVVFALCACAQPKYERVVENSEAGQGSQREDATACQVKFSASQYCVSWNWIKKPTDSEVGSLSFKIYRANALDNSPVLVDAPTTPELILWMPSMGHGSSPTKVARVDVGTYLATEVFFVMPGEWEFKFQIKEGSDVKDEAIVSLTI